MEERTVFNLCTRCFRYGRDGVMEGRLIELDGFFCWHGLEESGHMALIYEASCALPLCIRYYSLVRWKRGEELKWFFCCHVVVVNR